MKLLFSNILSTIKITFKHKGLAQIPSSINKWENGTVPYQFGYDYCKYIISLQ
jgi:hypothetical protein